MRYSVINTTRKIVSILLDDVDGNASLQEIISIADKEFPKISLDKLIIVDAHNPSVIYLQLKNP